MLKKPIKATSRDFRVLCLFLLPTLQLPHYKNGHTIIYHPSSLFLSVSPSIISIYRPIHPSMSLSIYLSHILSIRPSIFLSIFLSIYWSIHQSIPLIICPSIHHINLDPSINVSFHISNYCSSYPSIFQYIYLFINVSVCPSIHPSIHPSIYPSFNLFIHHINLSIEIHPCLISYKYIYSQYIYICKYIYRLI